MAARKKAKTVTVRKGNKLKAPEWTGWESWDGKAYHQFSKDTFKFYYENFKPADLLPALFNWMKENGYTKDDVSDAKAASYIETTPAIYANMLLKGMPAFAPAENEYWTSLPGTMGELEPVDKFVHEEVKNCITRGKQAKLEKAAEDKERAIREGQPTLTIQQRIRQQAIAATEDIDNWLEGFLTQPKKFDVKAFDVVKHFKDKAVTQAHARKILAFYQPLKDEFILIQNIPTPGKLKKMSDADRDNYEQIKQAYKHLKKTDVAKYLDALEAIVDACTHVIDASKATRKKRTPRPKSVDKVVQKLKYCQIDDKYKISSVTPSSIVGASELWVFNTKTRKIGKYVADKIDPTGQGRDGSGLSVKGTTIIGYDEAASIQKTLRKPEEQLKEFKAAGKVKLRKYLDSIATMETKLNGRTNEHTVLLKVS